MKRICIFTFVGMLLLAAQARAFQATEGCGAGACKDCHTMAKQEAAGLLALKEDQVLDVKLSEVPGLWVVDINRQGRTMPVYLDFSKKYLITGSVIKLADNHGVVRERVMNRNRINLSQVPLDDALPLGSSTAPVKIVVFEDPQCPYCRELHGEMRKVVNERPGIVFLIKMLPLAIHPEAYNRAKTIVCGKSLALLEDSLAGTSLPPPDCPADQIEKNIALADKFAIRSTPTLILPDGRVVPGFKRAADIIRLLDEPRSEPGAGGGSQGCGGS